MLLHLQGHDLLLLGVSQVVGGAPLGAAAPVDVVPALVLLVVERSECENVEEEEGSSYSNGHRQLGGVVALVHHSWLEVAVLGLGWERSRVGVLGHHRLGLRGAVGRLRWRDLETGGTLNTMKSFFEKNLNLTVCTLRSRASIE